MGRALVWNVSTIRVYTIGPIITFSILDPETLEPVAEGEVGRWWSPRFARKVRRLSAIARAISHACQGLPLWQYHAPS